MQIIEYIKDKYLTWRTGQDKQTRDWNKWYEETVVFRADTIENMFMNFKYILPVSINIFDLDEPFGWALGKDIRQYMYPNRALGDCAVHYFARGFRHQWDGRFHLNEISGGDQVFIATNNSKDAMMITLKYS